MPRTSAASLAVAPINAAAPSALPPPSELTTAEAAIWRDTIGRATWITADMKPLALAYVRSAAQVDAIWAEMKSSPDLHAAYCREVKLLAMLARSLRLTAQARQDRSKVRPNDNAPRADFRAYFEGQQ